MNDLTHPDQLIAYLSIAPHTDTQPSLKLNEPYVKRVPVTAFLSVYIVHRCYGGPEEGGWWYDAYEHTGASFPFQAEQAYEAVELNEDHSSAEWWDDVKGAPMVWEPRGLPCVIDEPTRVRVESARHHFIAMYGDPDAEQQHRFSMAPRGVDFAFVYEIEPGAREREPRPRWS